VDRQRGRKKQAAARDGCNPLAQRVQRGEQVRVRVEEATNAARPEGMSFWNLNAEVSKTEQNRIRKEVLAEMAVEVGVPKDELKVDLRLAEAIQWVRKQCGTEAADAILSGSSGLTQEQVARLDGMSPDKIREMIERAGDAVQ
jgi:hypothetical protein